MFHLQYNINNYQRHDERIKNKEKLYFLVVWLKLLICNISSLGTEEENIKKNIININKPSVLILKGKHEDSICLTR